MRSPALLALVLLAGCAAAPADDGAPVLRCPPPCAATVAQAAGDFWEPHVAIDPADARHLVAGVTVRSPGPPAGDDQLVAASFDGGATWSTTRIPHGPGAGPGHPLAAYTDLADPTIAFVEGTVLVGGLAYGLVRTPAGVAGANFAVYVARSGDGGLTFPEVVVVRASIGAATISPLGNRGVLPGSPDAPVLGAAPDGRLHVFMRELVQPSPLDDERSVVLHAWSDDAGRTWSALRAVATAGLNAVVAPPLVFPRDGGIVAAAGAWPGGGLAEATAARQVVLRSGDRGASWSALVVDDEFNSNFAWWPTAAESAGGLHVFYAQQDGDGRERVVGRLSRDGGRTFTDAAPWTGWAGLGTALPTAGGDGQAAFLTWFEPQASGAIHLRALATAGAGATDPVLLDGTLTQDAASLGEYFGLAATGGRAYAAWTNNEEPGGGRLMGAWLHLGPAGAPGQGP